MDTPNPNRSNEDQQEIDRLEAEERALEQRPHDGFADAVRSERIRERIEDLEKDISRAAQKAIPGQG